MLDYVDVEHLDNYSEFLRTASQNYGPDCWFIVYTADVRMRSEQFERLRRRLEETHVLAGGGATAHPPSIYVPARPWNAVFAEAVADKAWWDSNLREKAVLYLTKLTTAAAAVDDGTVQPGLNLASDLPRQVGPPKNPRDSRARAPPEVGEPESRGARPEAPRERASLAEQDSSGRYTKNHKGNKLCDAFNNNRCGKPAGDCPKHHRHQCSMCLGTHSATDHNKIMSGEIKGAGSSKKGQKRKGKF